jgi:hypothetical protein
MVKYLRISSYEKARLNFLINEENFVFFFISFTYYTFVY